MKPVRFFTLPVEKFPGQNDLVMAGCVGHHEFARQRISRPTVRLQARQLQHTVGQRCAPAAQVVSQSLHRRIGPSQITGTSFLVLFLRKAGSTCVHENNLYFSCWRSKSRPWPAWDLFQKNERCARSVAAMAGHLDGYRRVVTRNGDSSAPCYRF